MSVPGTLPRLSPGFLRSLFGIAVTVLAWIGPWSWPAWPALAVLELTFSPAQPFVALSRDARAAVVFVLTVVNVSSWALLAWGLAITRERIWRTGAPAGLSGHSSLAGDTLELSKTKEAPRCRSSKTKSGPRSTR